MQPEERRSVARTELDGMERTASADLEGPSRRASLCRWSGVASMHLTSLATLSVATVSLLILITDVREPR
jgi:hypothetical protein